jgi:hypothetical protein
MKEILNIESVMALSYRFDNLNGFIGGEIVGDIEFAERSTGDNSRQDLLVVWFRLDAQQHSG